LSRTSDAGWERHRLYQLRIRDGGKMARDSARDRPFNHAHHDDPKPGQLRLARIPEGYGAAARSSSVEFTPRAVRNVGEIEDAISSLATPAAGGLIVLPDTTTSVNRRLIVSLAEQHRVPAMYPFRFFVAEGGLASYGLNVLDVFRRAASYVDRILRGENAGDLPIQAPTQFELVINLRTAKAVGLTIPPTLLARADEVIE
jgi:putative tryptophan/tyrosine transport system substrate-binding protein